jgi:drug/metabolite transporter (DMT)-like permease
MKGVDGFAVLAMLLQQTINGAYTVLAASVLSSKDPTKKIRPEMFAIIRDGGATILLLAMARHITKDGTQGRFWPKREHIGDFVLIGACGVWAGQLLGAIAIKNIGAVIFAVMQPAQPVLTLIIAVAIGMEKLQLCGSWSETSNSWAKVVGMVITVTGAVLVLLLQPHSKPAGGGSIFFGSLILMLEVVMGALYGIFQKGVLKEYHSIVVTAWGYFFGTHSPAIVAYLRFLSLSL